MCHDLNQDIKFTLSDLKSRWIFHTFSVTIFLISVLQHPSVSYLIYPMCRNIKKSDKLLFRTQLWNLDFYLHLCNNVKCKCLAWSQCYLTLGMKFSAKLSSPKILPFQKCKIEKRWSTRFLANLSHLEAFSPSQRISALLNPRQAASCPNISPVFLHHLTWIMKYENKKYMTYY